MRNLMNNSLRMLLSAFLLMILLSCQDKAKEEKQYSPTTQKLIWWRATNVSSYSSRKPSRKARKSILTPPPTRHNRWKNTITSSTIRRPPCRGMSFSVPGSPVSSGECIRLCAIAISSTACRWRRWKAKRCLRILCNTWNLTAAGW